MALIHPSHSLLDISNHSDPNPTVESFAEMYNMAEQPWDVEVRAFQAWLRQNTIELNNSILCHISMTRCSFETLRQDASDLDGEWVQCQASLNEYSAVLEKLHLGVAWSHGGEAHALRSTLSQLVITHDPMTSPRSRLEDQVSRAALFALLGWAYYGQVLAPRFSIYIRIIIRLAQVDTQQT